MKDKDLLKPIAPWRQWKPEGSRYLLKQTLSMEGNWIRAPAESPECRILPPCQQAGCRNIWTNTISGANGVTRTRQPREDSELWGSLDFPTRPRLIYQPTSEADTGDLVRVQLYHTRPHPYPVGLEHSEQTLINPPVSEHKSWSWKLWPFFLSSCPGVFTHKKNVQCSKRAFLLLLTPGNLQGMYRL